MAISILFISSTDRSEQNNDAGCDAACVVLGHETLAYWFTSLRVRIEGGRAECGNDTVELVACGRNVHIAFLGDDIILSFTEGWACKN